MVSDITPERRRHAGPDLVWPADKRSPQQTARVINPLDRLHEREQISDRAYAAGVKFRRHHLGAGMFGRMGTVDLHRIFSFPHPGETQALHILQYKNALAELGIIRLGVVEMVCCYDTPLERRCLPGPGGGGQGTDAVRRQIEGSLEA
jgi:hypothetical protein